MMKWKWIDPLEEGKDVDFSDTEKANFPKFIKKTVMLPLWKSIGWRRFFIADWWRLKLSKTSPSKNPVK